LAQDTLSRIPFLEQFALGWMASIGDLFTSLGTEPPVLDPRFAEVKERVRPAPGVVEAAWRRLETALSHEVAEIKARGSSIIPCVDYSEIAGNGGEFPDAVAEAVRRRGCVVVRNVLSEATALSMKAQTKEYIAKNQELLSGFPKDNPQVWEVYWSKPQGEMRMNPAVLETQTALNRLWHCRAGHDGQVLVDVHRPLTYGERLRIREAGDTSFTLGPHIDGGSVERWEDDEYRRVYDKILTGEWENYDAWDATHRAEARCDLYCLGVGLCSIFRSFQGWLSLSRSGHGRGALMVVPLVRETSAFLMLRPFLDDVPESSFCGANPGKTQDLLPKFHAAVIEGLVPIPDVGPGDTVWWHCDLIHAVEGSNGSVEDSSVFYIPAVPLCVKNAEYAAQQAGHFVLGKTPPDFPQNHSEVHCVDRCSVRDLNEAGLVAHALGPLPESAVDGESEEHLRSCAVLHERCRHIFGNVRTGDER